MKSGNGHAGGGVFGSPDRVTVERGLGEFRAGRPVMFATGNSALIALPVDGLDASRLAAFEGLCLPTRLKVAVTAKRARSLGIETDEPVLLALPDEPGPEPIYALATNAGTDADATDPIEPADAAVTSAIELAKLAHRLPALLVADGEAASKALIEPPLVVVAPEAVMKFRRAAIQSLAIAGEAKVPLHGSLSTRFVVFRDAIGGGSVAVVVGNPDFSKPVPVRLHSSCLTGDVFGSSRCDCGDQLRLALSRLNEEGGGIILYLEQEGRGVGLANKIRAYALQDGGLDTVDANTTLGFDDDERDYRVAARMLQMLGCTRVQLLTNNPAKLAGLVEAGIEVSGRKSLQAPINAHNRRYLTAKAMRAGHKLDHLMAALADAGEPKIVARGE